MLYLRVPRSIWLGALQNRMPKAGLIGSSMSLLGFLKTSKLQISFAPWKWPDQINRSTQKSWYHKTNQLCQVVAIITMYGSSARGVFARVYSEATLADSKGMVSKETHLGFLKSGVLLQPLLRFTSRLQGNGLNLHCLGVSLRRGSQRMPFASKGSLLQFLPKNSFPPAHQCLQTHPRSQLEI